MTNRLPITSSGIGRRRKILDQIDLALLFHRIEQRIDQTDQPLAPWPRWARGGERAHHDLAHARVLQRRIVEDEARGVVLVERRVAILGRNSTFLSDEKAFGVAIDPVEIGQNGTA